MPKPPRLTVKDAQVHVERAAQGVQGAVKLLRGARDELVRALLALARLQGVQGQRAALLPLTVLSVVSSAFDLLTPLAGRLETLSTTTPEKVEAEWRDVVRGIFGD